MLNPVHPKSVGESGEKVGEGGENVEAEKSVGESGEKVGEVAMVEGDGDEIVPGFLSNFLSQSSEGHVNGWSSSLLETSSVLVLRSPLRSSCPRRVGVTFPCWLVTRASIVMALKVAIVLDRLAPISTVGCHFLLCRCKADLFENPVINEKHDSCAHRKRGRCWDSWRFLCSDVSKPSALNSHWANLQMNADLPYISSKCCRFLGSIYGKRLGASVERRASVVC